MQYYGLTGRKIKPDYVGVLNAGARNLPAQKQIADEEAYRTKTLADTEAYRDKSFALEADRMAQEEKLARDTLKANEKESENATYIGLGQLGVSAFQGRKRDAALKEAITGGGSSGKTSGSVAPTVSGDTSAGGKESLIPDGDNTRTGTMGLGSSTPSTGVWEGIKGGASNWGDIAAGTLAGATVGSKLGEKLIDDTDLGRAAGAALTSGALSYMSSGNLYTAAISSIFGGALGALF